MADQRPDEQPIAGSPATATISIGGWIPVPEEHPTLYANWVQVSGTGSETFIDFFLLDAHLRDGELVGKQHFLTRVVLHDGAKQALLQLLAQNAPS